MKRSTVLLVLFLAAVCAAVIGVVSVMTEARKGAEPAASGDVAHAQIVRLEGDVLDLESRCNGLQQALAVQSNRADTAVVRLKEEKDTNEPLRRQIERNLAMEIAYKSELEKRDSELKNGQATLEKLQKDLEGVRADAQRLTRQVEEAQAAKRATEDASALLKTQLGMEQTRAADAGKLVAALQAEIKLLKDALASEKVRADKLEKDAAAVPVPAVPETVAKP